MTAIEWLEQQIKDTYDKEGKLPLAYTLDLVNQAKELEEENYAREYMHGYGHGWRQMNKELKEDITRLYNKFIL